jgi:hypothetical protein
MINFGDIKSQVSFEPALHYFKVIKKMSSLAEHGQSVQFLQVVSSQKIIFLFLHFECLLPKDYKE